MDLHNNNVPPLPRVAPEMSNSVNDRDRPDVHSAMALKKTLVALFGLVRRFRVRFLGIFVGGKVQPGSRNVCNDWLCVNTSANAGNTMEAHFVLQHPSISRTTSVLHLTTPSSSKVASELQWASLTNEIFDGVLMTFLGGVVLPRCSSSSDLWSMTA